MGGRIYIFWVLSLMSVEGKMSNINEHLFEMVMWAGFLRLLVFGWMGNGKGDGCKSGGGGDGQDGCRGG